MRYRILFLTLITILSLSACNLGRDSRPGDQDEQQAQPTNTPGGRPEVRILSPQDGAEVVVNDPVLVSVNASDSIGVTRVQLFANGQIVRTVSSETASGETSRNMVLDYTPRSQGEVLLRVVAFRGSVASDPAEISITVRPTQSQVTATVHQGSNIPQIDPNDPTCRALVNTGLNFRQGPSTSYNIIRVLRAGEVLPIQGRLGDNSWWQLRSGTTIGWVDARFVTTYGMCAGIPVASPPATATPAVTATPTPTNTVPPIATSPPTATQPPALPDLTITNVAGPEEVTIPAGETSVTERYSVSITNLGGPINQQFSNTVRILPGNEEFDVGVVSNLNAGQSISLNVDITFTSTGTFLLRFTADSDGEIQESNEANNIGTYEVTVTGG
jgi:hypothetical protein